MQITLNHDEITGAIEAYVRERITVSPNQRIEIDLKAGRGENGFSATLDIVPANHGIAKQTTYRGSSEAQATAATRSIEGNTNKANMVPKASISSTPEDRQPPEETAAEAEADEANADDSTDGDTADHEARTEASAAKPAGKSSIFSKAG